MLPSPGRRVSLHVRVALVAIAVATQEAEGQESVAQGATALPTNRVVIRRAPTPIRVDARLDDEAWMDATEIALAFETYPGDNTPARTRTACWVTFDSTNLYFACHAYDGDSKAIRAVRADRDDVAEHDRVGITIDPFNDRRRAWQFAVNPLGVQFDAVYDAATDSPDGAWNAIWTSAGHITDGGYIVEAAIPFKSLRFPASDSPQSWGFIAWRHRPRDGNIITQSVAIDPAVRCVLCQAGAISDIAASTPSRNVELGPTLTTIRTDSRLTTADRLRRGAARSELGLDARWNVTPDITVNATFNPDFSQVEADAAQLDANRLFALSYPERRPFFLDGADLFTSPQNVLFTRTIADPMQGIKLTAKHGRTAFGLLGARDATTNLLVGGPAGSSQSVLDRRSVAFATRIRRDVMGSSTVGALGTWRQSEGYANHVYGVDALLRPHSTTTVTAQALASRTRYPDSLALRLQERKGAFDGSVVGLQARYQTRAGNAEATAWRYSRGFRADLGFIPRVGVLEAEFHGDRVFWGKPGSLMTRLAAGAGYYPTRHDTTPAFTNAWRFVRLSYEGPGGLVYNAYARLRTETFRGVRYDFWTPWMFLRVQPWSTITASVDGTFGGEIDYVAQRLASTMRLTPSATVRLGRSGEARVRHSALRLRSGGDMLLRAGVSEIRGAYHPTSRMFARALLQYRTTRRTAAGPAGVVHSARSLSSQLLLSYRVDAQTAALVGFGETREPLVSNLPGPLAADRDWEDLRPLSRTFFLKLSYAWRP
jgi:hypothetical protein